MTVLFSLNFTDTFYRLSLQGRADRKTYDTRPRASTVVSHGQGSSTNAVYLILTWLSLILGLLLD
jgi:hypothetical protein